MRFFLNNFLIRTPLLPYNISALTEEKLMEAFLNPVIQEALYIASPVLYTELQKLFNNQVTDLKARNKLFLSFAKYYSRMQSRCTPYGLFAGCSVGSFGEQDNIRLPNINKSRHLFNRHTRPDMHFLGAYSMFLSKNPGIRKHLRYFTNNTLYRIGSQFRYIEYNYSGSKRIHQISSVIVSDYLTKVIEYARDGATVTELAQLLVNHEVSLEESTEFIHSLIEGQVLTSELEPTVTGKEFTYQLIDQLKEIHKKTNSSDLANAIDFLSQLQNSLNYLDNSIINSPEAYRQLFNRLSQSVPVEENQLFQVDLFKETIHAELDKNLQTKLMDAFNFFNKFSLNAESKNLIKFKDAFYARYEEEEVPLSIALDIETGVGYPSKDLNSSNILIDDLYIQPVNKETDATINSLQEVIMGKYFHALKNDLYMIQFTDCDLETSDSTTADLPSTVPVMFKILTKEGKICIYGFGGSSAVNILGRFAHGNEEINSMISRIIEFEEQQFPGHLFAEIVHLPENRVGNILLRPVFRKFEIPYLAKAAVFNDNQIKLDDLYISIKNNKIILRSKRLNKEIIPRLSTAHNYSYNQLPVYQFLCDIQNQFFKKSSFGFDWGIVAQFANFLPRVEYKNVIVCPATWILAKKDFESITKKEAIGLLELKEWRESLKMPALIYIAEGDSKLPIDLSNELSIRIFLDLIKRNEKTTISEFIEDIHNSLIKDEADNGYTHECLAILFNPKEKSSIPGIADKTTNHENIQRVFSVGSEWLYYKIYCGVKSADKILVEAIQPLVTHLFNLDLIKKWFFIRYNDGDWHIRLRFMIPFKENVGEVITIAYSYFNPIISVGLANKIQLDTYTRELERYHYNCIDTAETFFSIDSQATIDFLEMTDPDNREKLRWQFAAKAIDDLLDAFDMDLASKRDFMQSASEHFIREHGDPKDLKPQLDNKYRALKKDLDYFLDTDNLPDDEFEPLKLLIARKKKEMRRLAIDVKSKVNKENHSKIIPDLLISFVHMMLNRIFISRQRTNEMIVYSLLFRNYKSQFARLKQHNMAT